MNTFVRRQSSTVELYGSGGGAPGQATPLLAARAHPCCSGAALVEVLRARIGGKGNTFEVRPSRGSATSSKPPRGESKARALLVLSAFGRQAMHCVCLAIFVASYLIFDAAALLHSVAGAVALNLVVDHHRKGR